MVSGVNQLMCDRRIRAATSPFNNNRAAGDKSEKVHKSYVKTDLMKGTVISPFDKMTNQ